MASEYECKRNACSFFQGIMTDERPITTASGELFNLELSEEDVARSCEAMNRNMAGALDNPDTSPITKDRFSRVNFNDCAFSALVKAVDYFTPGGTQ